MHFTVGFCILLQKFAFIRGESFERDSEIEKKPSRSFYKGKRRHAFLLQPIDSEILLWDAKHLCFAALFIAERYFTPREITIFNFDLFTSTLFMVIKSTKGFWMSGKDNLGYKPQGL